MQTRGLFHRLDTKYRPLEKLDGDGDRTMLTCTYVYVLLYEGKCKWSYGPSYHVDFPLNIFIHSFNQVHVRLLTQNRNSSRLEHQRLLLCPAFQYHAVWWI